MALDPQAIAANLARIRERVGPAVEVLAATKYVEAGDLPALSEGGVTLVGENRSDALEAKQEAHGELFTWDFIGHLQSRKVRQILPYVRYVETVASESALEQLRRHGTPSTQVLVEVNMAGEEGKSGIAPEELPPFLERCPVKVVGLMTMPPLAPEPEASRRHFAALRELAAEHELPQLSMGTSQDYLVAIQEGATIVRLGSSLYRASAS